MKKINSKNSFTGVKMEFHKGDAVIYTDIQTHMLNVSVRSVLVITIKH